ncbi:MAG: AgmX/PglI C-terminal domain-containing protein [Halobacteriovoraceae bacterium]|jgi:hypothetical protein|nr:AgmX/PglI C-terminal domain-containing protein [Halobacteriovoraceae bacterium]
MISIQTVDGDLIKVINDSTDLNFGFHKLFGFTSQKRANKREEVRKRQGFDFTSSDWQFQFSLKKEKDNIRFSNLKSCSVGKINNHEWELTTPIGSFKVSNTSHANINDFLIEEKDTHSWMNRMTEIIILAIFILIPILYFFEPEVIETVEEKTKIIKPVAVTIVQQVKAVNVSPKAPAIKIKPLNKAQKSKRAVRRNLGFLGLIGSKELTKAVGGVPQKLAKVTAGAGAGGDAGSGGEVLTGLGKGLRKTTVGNTGVAGLGGIGTKGAGGGAGGYGNTVVASGEGVGISAISVASNDMVLDGGLSRYAINATIAKYLSQVRRCYENQLNKQSGLEGLVTVSFQINGTGGLNYSRINNSSLKSPVVEKCITTKMMNWKFPKPKGGVNVNINYPFMLRPVGT